MNDERTGKEQERQSQRSEQERLHKRFTPIEEEYHAAYPDVKAPWTTAFLSGLFGRYNRGFIIWALVGAGVAVLFWVLYSFVD